MKEGLDSLFDRSFLVSVTVVVRLCISSESRRRLQSLMCSDAEWTRIASASSIFFCIKLSRIIVQHSEMMRGSSLEYSVAYKSQTRLLGLQSWPLQTAVTLELSPVCNGTLERDSAEGVSRVLNEVVTADVTKTRLENSLVSCETGQDYQA